MKPASTRRREPIVQVLFRSEQPRGVLRVALKEFQRHYWHYVRLVWRKGFIIQISERQGRDPVIVMVPHWLYMKWQSHS